MEAHRSSSAHVQNAAGFPHAPRRLLGKDRDAFYAGRVSHPRVRCFFVGLHMSRREARTPTDGELFIDATETRAMSPLVTRRTLFKQFS